MGDVEAQRQRAGQRIVNARLSPRPVEVDLGGIVVATWAYDQTVPGPVLRAGAGDLLRVEVDNQLDEPTSVHWHGIALRNDMDGVPGLTQEAIEPGDRFIYEFTVPDAGTHWYHSHSGLQLDRGLYGPLIIDDPAEPGDFDHEWVVVVDDWLDGIDGTPDDAARALGIDTPNAQGKAMGHGRMHGGGPGHQSMTSRLLGAADDVSYPHFLLNGKVPADPDRWTARPGQRAKIRFINAGADTFFRVAVGGHTMTVTHTDGFPT
ncbi:MAG: multicopper oxidase family protein, partial [Dietzia sp.]